MRCVICGKSLYGKLNTDHVFPRSVYKWLECVVSPENYARVYALIESDENKTRVHKRCNESKSDSLPEIGALYLTKEKSGELYALREKLEAYTAVYSRLKTCLYEKQSGACFSCGVPLGDNGVLRRIDPVLSRTEDNGCLVCESCNEKYPDFKNDR